MKQIILIIVFFSYSLNALSQSNAKSDLGIYIEETLFPKYVNKNDTSSTTQAPGVGDERGLGYDSRTTLGYLFFKNMFLFGFTLDLYSLSTKRRNVEGGDPGLKENTSEWQWGPTLGWFLGGFRILTTFFVGGKKTVETINFDASGQTGNTIVTNDKCSGFQLTVGYGFLFGPVEIGPSLVYRSLTYKRQSNTNKLNSAFNYQNRDLYSPSRSDELTPMLSIIARF